MIEVTPLGECIGAEVRGLDLSQPHSAMVAGQLNAALLKHLVLVVRNQDLSPAQFRDALAMFGEPMAQHRARFILEECPEVAKVASAEGFPPAVMWHCDHTNHERPPKISSLYGVTIPEVGGNTEFANMYVAYERLPADTKAQLRRLHTLNSMEDGPSYTAQDRARYPGGIPHPVVRLHPETGRPALFFHVTKSQSIEGMAHESVRPFLEGLLAQGIGEESVYSHRWQEGDVLICDNRCTMHRVIADYPREAPRVLWRTLVRGERPVGYAH